MTTKGQKVPRPSYKQIASHWSGMASDAYAQRDKAIYELSGERLRHGTTTNLLNQAVAELTDVKGVLRNTRIAVVVLAVAFVLAVYFR